MKNELRAKLANIMFVGLKSTFEYGKEWKCHSTARSSIDRVSLLSVRVHFSTLTSSIHQSSPDETKADEHERQQHRHHPLSRSVPTINDNISPSSVRTSITRQIDIGALEFLRLGITAQRDHTMPQLLNLLIHKVRQTRINITRRDAIDASEVPPLVRQRLGQMDTSCLGDIVRRLLLREIGNVAGHAGSDDEGAGLALAEMQPDGAGAVEGPVQIGIDDLVPRLDAGVQDAGVGRAARVGDEDVDAAEVFDHVRD